MGLGGGPSTRGRPVRQPLWGFADKVFRCPGVQTRVASISLRVPQQTESIFEFASRVQMIGRTRRAFDTSGRCANHLGSARRGFRRKSVRSDRLLPWSDPQSSVTGAQMTRPQPASVSYVYVLPEPLLKRRLRSGIRTSDNPLTSVVHTARVFGEHGICAIGNAAGCYSFMQRIIRRT